MKNSLLKRLLFISGILIIQAGAEAQNLKTDSLGQTSHWKPPDTATVGIYITSIHDIDFKNKEFSVAFWLWVKYKDRKYDFIKYLEIPNAKTVTPSFVDIDSSDGYYILMKVLCVMKDSWKIQNFPFDNQTLRISIENSEYPSDSLILKPDTAGKFIAGKYTMSGWNLDTLKSRIYDTITVFETAFGDASYSKPHSEYSSIKVRLYINRNATGLFWKLFFGMYIAFIIAYLCFYIHVDNYDSRFQLTVGALFAVIGNKYIVDSSLPETTSFTLVDTLHLITLIFIMLIIIANAFSLISVKRKYNKKAYWTDMITGQILLVAYVALNILFISGAASGK